MSHAATPSVVDAAIREWGAGAAREAGPADELGRHAPGVVLEPHDSRELAAMLAWADGERLAVVPRGAGTKITWGGPPSRLDVILSTARINAPVEHCAGDLTATLPAGTTLAAANEILAGGGQWLPVDPLFGDRATIGGIIATNDSGPRRYKYGTPRDLIIGVEMALADGRLAKAGGRVVKNVAGYDLGRLACGSYGALAVITSATFKLAPLPRSSRTVLARHADLAAICETALAVAAAPALNPSSIEIDAPEGRLLMQFESAPLAAERQADRARVLCGDHGLQAEMLEPAADADAWRAYRSGLETATTLLKLSVLPTAVGDTIGHIVKLARDHGVTWRARGRAALGVIFVALDGPPERQLEVIAGIRTKTGSHQGSTAVLAANPAFPSDLSVWGSIGDAIGVMRALKSRFDPNGTLQPGRGPGGL